MLKHFASPLDPIVLGRVISPVHHPQWLAAAALLGRRGNRDRFLQALEQARRRYYFVVGGYVVMPEHLHLLVSAPGPGNEQPKVKLQRREVA